MDGYGVVTVSKDVPGRMKVSFLYDLQLVAKVKTIEGRKWHPAEKYWSVPDSDGILEKILKAFEGEEIHLDPALQDKLPTPVIARPEGSKQSQFDDLRRELLTRKYSRETVKAYLYYNRDFIGFTDKRPLDISENDIKDYLLYLVEERESATSTLNQAINALKFYPALLQKCGVYYGTILKKKFLYEIKRPRKDKKLPVVLSKEEVAKILSSIDNIKHKAILMIIYSAGLRVGDISEVN